MKKSKLTWFKEDNGEWTRYYPYYFRIERVWFWYETSIYCRNIKVVTGIAITRGIAKRLAEKQLSKYLKQSHK